jgi:hypothetical protein
MLAPISWRTPPRHYGPWEQVTSLLTEALVARGVDVTLFATKDTGRRPSWMLSARRPIPRMPRLTQRCGKCSTSPMSLSRPASSLFTTMPISFRSPSRGWSQRVLVEAHSARLQGIRRPGPLCRDQPSRSQSRLALCGNDPSRYPAGGLSLRSAWQRGSAFLWPHSP